MKVSDFDFELPPERIALRPAVPRESARLLQVGATLSDHRVVDLPQMLRGGDILVLNDTKVIPASLKGQRIGRGGTVPKIEVLLHQRVGALMWKAFARPAKKLDAGDEVAFGAMRARVVAKGDEGEVTLDFSAIGDAFEAALELAGEVPLPPYIKSKRTPDAQDRTDYQSIFAEKPGAVAAPTASLHFTPELMKALQVAGVATETVTLHVGAGTFLPVKVGDTADHRMHFEHGEIGGDVAERLRLARREGRRVIAVGTTSLRLLEASGLDVWSGATDIFITPGYKFRAVDGLITNFHLPRSTLFMLVSALAGVERMKRAYAHAITHGYRFYSYGDASLLWPSAT
jgi:S-adenosylmethionine:tRNA ribosyltransferase-isomerase